MPYTIEYLVKRTPRLRKRAARYVRITRLKFFHDKKGKPVAACQSYSTHDVLPSGRVVRRRTKVKYVTVIKLLNRKYHCVVSCSCPDFMFTSEWVLHQKGSADIEYSNGEPPNVRNLFRRPMLCKHLVALYEKIKPELEK